MNLKNCTKDELLFIIDHMSRNSYNGHWHCTRALAEVEYRREKTRLAEAEKVNKMASSWYAKYADVMAPYADKSLADIPLSALRKADHYLSKVKECEQRWDKLMGIRRK